MATEPVETTLPIFATRAALDAHIAAMGHRLNQFTATDTCHRCNGTLEQHDEEGDTVDVDARLLAPCQESVWVRYSWGEADDDA